MSDGAMPGSAHATTPNRQIRVTFVPEDVQQPYRTVVANTFTEMVIILQHMWESSDSYVEMKWEENVDSSVPGDALFDLPGSGGELPSSEKPESESGVVGVSGNEPE